MKLSHHSYRHPLLAFYSIKITSAGVFVVVHVNFNRSIAYQGIYTFRYSFREVNLRTYTNTNDTHLIII